MAFEYFTQNPMVAVIFTFIGVLVIGYAKWYERKTAPGSTEVWDDKKFGMFFVVVAAVMIFEYFYFGKIEYPGDETINSLVLLLTPIFEVFGAAYATIIAGRLAKNNVVVPVIKDLNAKKANAVPIETNWLSATVTPTYKFGKSPVPVLFKIYTTQPTSDHVGVVSAEIDWADGSSQVIPIVKGEAEVSHTFSFVKNDKYTGHTFYPIFTFIGSDGSQTKFNLEGRSVEIWVESQ